MTTGRVFHRSAMPDPPIAVRAEGSTIWDADGRAYLDAAGGAIVVNVGHGRREIAAAMAEQAGRVAYAHGSAFTSEPLERYAASVGRHLPLDGAVDLPGLGRIGGHRDRPQARPGVPHRARTNRTAGSSSGDGGATTATRSAPWTCPGRKPLRRPYEGWLGRFRHLSAAYPYRAGDPGANALATGDELAQGARGGHRGGRSRDRGGVRGGADRRGDARRRRPARRLLAEDRRGLPPARRPAHRRRGHDRVRADRPLVRARPLGRPARPARRREGRDLGLLAVRVRRGLGRGPRCGRGRAGVRPWLHVLAWTGGGGRRQRGPADPGGRGSRRGQRDARASGSKPSSSRRSARTRTSATSAAAACSSASNSWRTGSRGRRIPAPPG